MKADVKVPAVGESITEATIAEWKKKNGEAVKRDDVLLILETDKASVEVVAEQDGVLTTKAKDGDVVAIGAVVGEIDSAGAASTASAAAPTSASTKSGMNQSVSAAVSAAASAATTMAKPSAPAANNNLSPAVRKIVAENNLNPAEIQGNGKDGRLTKQDALRASGAPSAAASAPAHAAPAKATEAHIELPKLRVPVDEEITREPMSRLRQTIAQRLVEAQHTAAILTTFNEIDMTNVMALREKYNEGFEKKYKIRMGFMGFFIKAVIEALKDVPKVNGSIEGNEMIFRNYYNIGVAVGTPKGLIVPVIRHAEMLSIAEIEMTIKHFAQKARDGKITVADLRDGTFTISNGGVYGSLMSTPILNPPQSGILGLHKIEDRPMAINKQVVIRPMMYVALSYDHRLIDGSESVKFLVKIKDCIEDPSRILLEV